MKRDLWGRRSRLCGPWLGSTTGIASGAGAVTGTYSYDAFGAVRAQTGVATEWSYTGEQNDPTGLEYLRARYYDPATGRFLSQDPLPLLHRYPYAGNNPANFIDPSGLYDTRAAVAVLVAAAAAGGPGAAMYMTAAMILRDPCWITHAFCPHPPFNWKKIGAATVQCAIGATFGGVVGGALGGPGGAAVGAAYGCAGGFASYWVNDLLGKWTPANMAGQCVVAGVSAGLAVVTAGKSAPSSWAVGATAGGSCVTAGAGVLWSALTEDAHWSGTLVTQCAVAGIGAGITISLARGSVGDIAPTGVGACFASGISWVAGNALP